MNFFFKTLQKLKIKLNNENEIIPHGPKGIRKVGHKEYVGGLWEEIGILQFNFLIQNGLKPSDIFMDIACGSLRAGIHIIPFLNQGNYLGIDKEKNLINLGLKNEISKDIIKDKKPEFVISSSFEFNKFSKKGNFAIAQSLFTHLPPRMIQDCFRKLKQNFLPNGVFFATYFISKEKVNNPDSPHDHGIFRYTYEEIRQFGIENGWEVEIIGNWNHPRNQEIVKYTLRQ